MPCATWLACIKGLHLPEATSSPSSYGVNVNGLIMTNGSSLVGFSPFFSLFLSLARRIDAELHNGTEVSVHVGRNIYARIKVLYTRVICCHNRACDRKIRKRQTKKDEEGNRQTEARERKGKRRRRGRKGRREGKR